MDESRTTIKMTNVSKRFGTATAVQPATFSVVAGEVVGFVGANGAGKTTTISMLLGFLAPSTGEIYLFGSRVVPSNAHLSHRRIGYAAGDMELPGQMTGRQYLGFVRSQRKSKADEYDRALLERFKPQLDKKIHTLSRGNKQKIALVAAFIGNPELVVFDEPTSGLDPVMQEVFLTMVRDCQNAGITIFMSSHYLQEVMEVCDRVLLMSRGAIVQDVSTAALQAMGGKHVYIKSGYRPTKPPKGAETVTSEFRDDLLHLDFVYKGDVGDLQRWISAVKQLHDVEISEYNLEESFKSLYQTEGTA